MRIGGRTWNSKQERRDGGKASTALSRKRKERGRQMLSADVKDSPRLPPLDLWIHRAASPGTHALHALTAGENLGH
jgi:hypothetical protein